MKKLVFTLSLSMMMLLTFSACKKEVESNNNSSSNSSNSSDSSNTIRGKWNLIGLYGILKYEYAPGEIEWTFNNLTATVTVNNTLGNSVYAYLPSGTYSYHEFSDSTQSYLVIDGNELGKFILSGDQIVIDGNKSSTGEIACGSYILLERD